MLYTIQTMFFNPCRNKHNISTIIFFCLSVFFLSYNIKKSIFNAVSIFLVVFYAFMAFDTAINHPSRKLFKLDEPDIQDTAGEARTSS